jgi:hypothetical membrane protein
VPGSTTLSKFWSKQVTREASRQPKTTWIQTFHDAVPAVGPLLFVFAVLYFGVQVYVAAAVTPKYSWLHNVISDLGNTACKATLCSPRHVSMNHEFWLLGALMAFGSLIIYHEFAQSPRPEERLIARLGFAFLTVGGIGAVLVGAFPENTIVYMHVIGAALAIGVGTLGIFGLGVALPDLPSPLQWGMRLVPPVALVALLLFGFHLDLGIGAGLVERIAAYPETLWLIVFGIYIMSSHRKRLRRYKELRGEPTPPLSP